MKAEKRQYYFNRIIECLLESDGTTIQAIADNVKLSKKTVQNKLAVVHEYMTSNDLGSIEKKPRIGIWLECSDTQRKQLQGIIYNQNEGMSIHDDAQRMYDVLSYIFKYRKKECITCTKLADYLYLSTPTILKILKDCEAFLLEYHIVLKNTRKKGIIIIFSESNYRNVLKKLIMRNDQIISIEKNMNDILLGVSIDEVKRIMLEVEHEWKIEFSDDSFYEILIYYCIAIHRCNQGSFKIDPKDYKTLEKYNEYTFAKSIFAKIEHRFGLSFSKDEVHFLVIQMLCSRFLKEEVDLEKEEVFKLFDANLIEFTKELIDYASNTLSKDLRKDEVLRKNLLIHLRATLFRFEYGKQSPNSLIYYIKKEYKHLFRQMWGLSVMFERYFNVKITEDEIGFICLYIQAALERIEVSINVLLVSNQNNGTNQFLLQRIHKLNPEIGEIKVCVSHDFKLHKYMEYPIILSLVKLPIQDDRILELNNALGEEWITTLSKRIHNLSSMAAKESCFDPICHKLFDPDLLMVNVTCSTKEEVLSLMCKRMEQKGVVSSEFHHSVMEREAATSTAIGSGIALPHGSQYFVNEPKVMMITLDHEILWDDELVDVVMLLAMRMVSEEEKRQAMKFYKQYVTLVETNEKVNQLKAKTNNLQLYQYLIR